MSAGSGCPPSGTSCGLALASRRSARAATTSKHQKNTTSANHPTTTYSHQPNVRSDYSRPLIDQHRFTAPQSGRTIGIRVLTGCFHAQLFAPVNEDVIAFEPMTAPADALRSGDGLRTVAPGESFSASFRINASG